jgi:hypothetical protein
MDNAAGDTGIFGGGVGGTGELLCGVESDGHKFAVGIVMLGYRFRLVVDKVELLMDVAAKLLGRLLVRDGHDSSSVASYSSSNVCISRCHSLSEQEDEEADDIGVVARSMSSCEAILAILMS